MFDTQDIDNSSTWRELKTVQNNILSLKSDLSGKFVKLHTDNQYVAQIVQKGSMTIELQEIVLKIFHICISYNIL